MERQNWTQRQRIESLRQVRGYVVTWGGWGAVLWDKSNFESFIAERLGCTPVKAREYIETLRGSEIFEARMRAKVEEAKKT